MWLERIGFVEAEHGVNGAIKRKHGHAIAGPALREHGIGLGLRLLPQVAAVKAGTRVQKHNHTLARVTGVRGHFFPQERPHERDAKQNQRCGPQQKQQHLIELAFLGRRRRGRRKEHQGTEGHLALRPTADQVEEDRCRDREQTQRVKGCEETHRAASSRHPVGRHVEAGPAGVLRSRPTTPPRPTKGRND